MKHTSPIRLSLRRVLLCLLIGAALFTAPMAQAQTDSLPLLPTETATVTATDGTPTTPSENGTDVQNSDETVEALGGLITQLVNTMSIERVFQWLMFLLFGGYLLAKATPTKRDDAVFESLISLLQNKQDKTGKP